MGDYSPPGLTLTGDLGGSASSPKVVGIQGKPVSSAAPVTGDALTWNGTAYTPATTPAGVASVFGRTGTVVAASGDYTAAQVTNAADKSASATQVFTGAVQVPGATAANVSGYSFAGAGAAFPNTNGVGVDTIGNLILTSVGGNKKVATGTTTAIRNWIDDGVGGAAVAGTGVSNASGLQFTGVGAGFPSSNGIGMDTAGNLILTSIGGNKKIATGTTTAIRNFVDDGIGNMNAIGGMSPGNSTAVGGAWWSGSGAPAAGLGANGDYYTRTDGALNTHIYFKSAGAWAAIV